MSSPAASCLFCASGRQRMICQHPLAYATPDTYPVSPGHTLIIPRRHVASYFDTTPEERLALGEMIDAARALIDAERKPDGYNIGINGGPAAGQSVPHLHIHLIPRYLGDKPDPRGGVRWVLPEKAAYWQKE